MNAEQKEQFLKESVMKLSEHFDYVQVFVGVREIGESYYAVMGNGDWYARYGVCREWIIKAEEQMRVTARADQ